MKRLLPTLAVIVTLAAIPAAADDVTEAKRMVCAPMTVLECRTDLECVSGGPWEFDIGPFVEIDLEKRRLVSTSRERQSDIKAVERDGELIVLQGYEMGRAYSFVISAPSGFITGSITLDDGALTIFGSCKPTGDKR